MVAKIYSKKSNSFQLYFEDPILGVLTPNLSGVKLEI